MLFAKPYFIDTPWLLRKYYPTLTWQSSTNENEIFLTFDDGPTPKITAWVLEQLKLYNAKATFFCIGKNVAQHTAIMHQIKAENHAIGNHTYNHVNGWKTALPLYIKEINDTSKLVNSNLFRPPYGRISKAQIQNIIPNYNIIMWSKLSADFDTKITGKNCFELLTKQPLKKGDIILFHDSEKAWARLQIVLPMFLEYASNKGFRFSALNQQAL